MKVQPVLIAVGFVCAFALGVAVGLFQTPRTSSGLARMTIDGHTVEYPVGSEVDFESFGNHRADEGVAQSSRDVNATTGGLTTNSDQVAQNYQQTPPTDGMGASAGGIISTVEAAARNPETALYLLGGFAILAGIVIAMKFDRVAGIAIALGGGVVIVAAYLVDSHLLPWVLGGVGIAALVVWWQRSAHTSVQTKALEAVAGAVEAAKRVNPEAAALVKKFVPDMAGDANLPAIKKAIEKAKA